jgi:uncharacterized protein DUF5696
MVIKNAVRDFQVIFQLNKKENNMITISNSNLVLNFNPVAGSLDLIDKVIQKNWSSAVPVIRCILWDVSCERKQLIPYSEFEFECMDLKEHSFLLFCKSEKFGIEFQMDYQLKGKAFFLNLPVDKLKELNANYKILSIDPLSQFGWQKTGSEGYMLIPSHSGACCKFNKREPRSHQSLIYMDQAQWEEFMVMPVMGAVTDSAAFLAIVSSGEYDTSVVIDVHQDKEERNAIYPRFHFREHKADIIDHVDRSVQYHFFNGDEINYVALAKCYRDYLINTRGVKPLKDRAKDNEQLDYFVNAYNEVRIAVGGNKKRPQADGRGEYVPVAGIQDTFGLIKAMHETGIDNAVLMLEYWTYEGGDGAYPTKLPVDPRLGTNEEFSALLEYANKLGYQTINWDNYTDAYRVSPDWDESYIMTDRDGWLRQGGIWNGGQGYLTCPYEMMNFVERDIEAQHELGFQGVWYIDAMVQPPRKCYHPDHNHSPTRRAYGEGLKKIVNRVKNTFHGCTIENANDFMADTVDGIAHISIHGDERYMTTTELGKYFVDDFVPFYPIAFHGLQVYHLSSLLHMEQEFGSIEIGRLKELELGAMPRADLGTGPYQNRDYRQWLPYMKQQYDLHCVELKNLQYSFIDNHIELTSGVFEVTFSNAWKIIVNYNQEVATYQNKKVNAMDFLIIKV